MKIGSHQDPAQAMQRVRVGMTGLAAVILLMVLSFVIFSSANREAPVVAAGASNAAVVANLTGVDNIAADRTPDEPLAELGVAPSTDAVDPAAAAKAREQTHQQEAAGK
jgi:cobalamin synthase